MSSELRKFARLVVDEAPVELGLVGEGDGMDEDVEPAPFAGNALEERVERGRVLDVGRQDQAGADALGERDDAAPEALALVGEGELGALRGEGAGRCPRRSNGRWRRRGSARACRREVRPGPPLSPVIAAEQPARRWCRRSRSCWTCTVSRPAPSTRVVAISPGLSAGSSVVDVGRGGDEVVAAASAGSRSPRARRSRPGCGRSATWSSGSAACGPRRRRGGSPRPR